MKKYEPSKRLKRDKEIMKKAKSGKFQITEQHDFRERKVSRDIDKKVTIFDISFDLWGSIMMIE